MKPATRRKLLIGLFGAFALTPALLLSQESVRGRLGFLWGRWRGGTTLAERLAQYAKPVAARLGGDFERAGLQYPPHELAYVAFKDVRILEVYGRMSATEPWRFVRQYPVLAASGKLGPKLAEGDDQVPEGIYRAEWLNPNSRFHLSIRLDYPNAFDRRMAKADHRTQLGGDIMIHGNAVSIGCLAMGDQAAEDLFVLAGLVSKEHVQIVVSPTDFRVHPQAVPIKQPPWVQVLYADLRTALQPFHKERGPAMAHGALGNVVIAVRAAPAGN